MHLWLAGINIPSVQNKGGCCVHHPCLLSLQVPNSPLLPSALTPLLTALTAACQQGGSPPLATRIHAVIMALTKGQAQVSGTSHAGKPAPILLLFVINVLTTLYP